MSKARKDYILFIGLTPMLLNALFLLVGYKPVVVIALVTSIFYASISNVSYSKEIKRMLLVSVLLVVAVMAYIYNATLMYGYSIYFTTIYAQAYYVLPIAMIALAHVTDFKRANKFFLIFIAATILQHIIFGFQGRYISHHMSDGVSRFPGITGHYHNSYISSLALILAAELINHVSAKVNIKNILLSLLVVILCGMPIFGSARGSILTNFIAISFFALVKLNKNRIQSIMQILIVIFFLFLIFNVVGNRIDNLISENSTYGYSGIADVVNVSSYSTEQNYTIRMLWWQEGLKETLSVSPIFGSVFENLDYAGFRVGSMNGSLMHSYFTGILQDGGVLLFILIMYLFFYPIVVVYRRRSIQMNVTKIVWLIAISGALASNTWMYGLKTGPIYSYLFAYASISIIRNLKAKTDLYA